MEKPSLISGYRRRGIRLNEKVGRLSVLIFNHKTLLWKVGKKKSVTKKKSSPVLNDRECAGAGRRGKDVNMQEVGAYCQNRWAALAGAGIQARCGCKHEYANDAPS